MVRGGPLAVIWVPLSVVMRVVELRRVEERRWLVEWLLGQVVENDHFCVRPVVDMTRLPVTYVHA